MLKDRHIPYEFGRGYWEAGYLDVDASAYGAGKLEYVFGCQSHLGEPFPLRRRYFSDEQRAGLQAVEFSLAARYPYPNRVGSTSDSSFESLDVRTIDSRECAPFDASDTDWSLEGEVGSCA